MGRLSISVSSLFYKWRRNRDSTLIRRRGKNSGMAMTAHTQPPGGGTPPPPGDADADAEKDDRRLDEELDETFPASDPIPIRHDSRGS